MFKQTLKLLGLSLATIALTACGGGGGGSEDSSSVQTALGGSSEVNTPTQNEIVLPDEEVLETTINLDRALASDTPATSISNSVMKGVTPYTIKSMWGSSSVSHYSAQTKHYYVAPLCKTFGQLDPVCGKADNDGTKESPWDFYGVTQGQQFVEPDSVVWLLEGEYSHPDNTADTIVPYKILISGSTNKPIHFRAENGNYNAVKINSGVNLAGNWLWLWDVEMTYIRQDGEIKRYDELTGALVDDWRPHTNYPPYYFNTSGYAELATVSTGRVEMNIEKENVSNCKVINNRSHKLGEGVSVWSTAANIEVYGNILYDNGWVDTNRGHGHGLYQQNITGTKRILSDNIIAGNMGHGLQIYSSKVEATENVDVIGNIFFAARDGGRVNNNPAIANGIVMGFIDSRNLYFNENYISSYSVLMPYAISAGDLYAADGHTRKYVTPANRQCHDNIFYAAYNAEAFDCNTEASNTVYNYYGTNPLSEVKSYIRPNKYDGRRANLVVINPNAQDTVAISLGTFAKKGDKIMILNPLDMNVPIEYGTYNGEYANIHWPDTTWKLARYVTTPDNNIKKEFWGFVVINLGQE